MNSIPNITESRALKAFLGLLSPRFKVLAYHSIYPQSRDPFEVSAEMFRKQMEILVEEKCRIISLEQSLDELRSGRITNKTIVITFDDGFRSLRDHAFPLLEQYQFPATVFVPFDFIGGIDSFSYEKPRQNYKLLSQAEIEFSMGKGFSYGSHTMSHSDLTRLSDERLSYELNASKRYLNERLGTKFSTLAYPFGMFDERVKRAAMNAGYACCVCFGNILSNSKYTSLSEMKREKILASTSLDEFRALINIKNDLPRKIRHHLK